jgi:CO/xanthine dehydrogenase FAD-binding subunit
MKSAGSGYFRPNSIPEALRGLAGEPPLIIAGGTDIYPAHVGKALPANVLDISAVAGLRGISRVEDFHRFGAATTWTDIIRASLPPAFAALQQAAREIGSIQVQNRGTIGGNICNASPAADGIPPLLILGAVVELASPEGPRRLPLSDFITGYRQTARRNDELLTAVLVPATTDAAKSSFVKLGARKYLVISIVMAAALIERDGAGAIKTARVAVGAASESARRLAALEADLLRLPRGAAPASILGPRHFAGLSPISDVRATADYRRDAAWALVAAALDGAA